MSRYRVAVVGATGAVGTEMRRLLRDRGYPASEIVPFASQRSAGRELEDGLVVRGLADDDSIGGFDVAIFSAGGSISREWAPRFAARGAIVVDNSSAFRMDPEVPLVVSEVNPEALDHIGKGIVANPNCTTMAIMPPLHALHVEFGLRAMVATSFQAAGGAGQKGMDELMEQVPGLLADPLALQRRGAEAAATVTDTPVFGKPLAFNVVPLLGTDTGNGYTDEEMKLQNESRKILGIEDLAVSPTCVRVPVMVGHSIEVRAQFEREPTVARALEVMGAHEGVELDDVPTPLEWAGRDPVAVGRVRLDLGDPFALNLFVVGDNLLKGAALNTVQIAELLHERGLLGARAAA
ncbi:aspartate-semialdehyde dehydrogenase [Baekduia soli]|uniref:Aspartate-semialdehyde dehydrogenase n=1 Tax=Baekduia soli TaxID=496014 RepID=A0A5B8U330_9ACTN|nr:aspartate-semialdehyde dehydrogenase [Baekduia soli]QEC47457.1 aspartate-semialdehyde dehydrogenase [Baekduia soli]